MGPHLHREIERLKRKVLALSALVEDNLQTAFEVVLARDAELAARVVEADVDVDLMEVEIEEDCLKLLALYQPVAGDLRTIVGIIKINTTLERVGDLGVNVAEHAARMSGSAEPVLAFDLAGLIEKSLRMFSRALDSLMKSDAALARLVLAADDEIDDLDDDLNEKLRAGMREHPEWLDGLISLLFISRYVERLADHATNIAEDVIYMTEGEIPRHIVKRQVAEQMGLGPRPAAPAPSPPPAGTSG